MTDQFEFPFGGEPEPEPKFQPPTARDSDPETSHDAAHDAEFHANRGRLNALFALARGPMTDYELEAHTGWQKNSIGKRRLECQRAGLVEVWTIDGEEQKRPGPSGSMCLIWRLTDKGVRYLDEKTDKAGKEDNEDDPDLF